MSVSLTPGTSFVSRSRMCRYPLRYTSNVGRSNALYPPSFMPSMMVTTVGLNRMTSRLKRSSISPAHPPRTVSPPTPAWTNDTFHDGKRDRTNSSTRAVYSRCSVMLSP